MFAIFPEGLIRILGVSTRPPSQAVPLTTVLAQDHFYSDFLSLHVSDHQQQNHDDVGASSRWEGCLRQLRLQA